MCEFVFSFSAIETGFESACFNSGISIKEGYTVDNLAVSFMDYNGEKLEDGTYPTKLITEFKEPLPEEKMKELGFAYLDGRCCILTDGRATYGSDNFGLFFGITWVGEDYGLDLRDIENFGIDFIFLLKTEHRWRNNLCGCSASLIIWL